MKTFFRLPHLFLLAIAVFAVTSCGEDDSFVIPPSIELLSDAGFLSADATINAGETISVRISASQGDNPMQAIEFQQDGVRMDAGRITIDGAAASSGAPLLFDGEKTALTWDVDLTAHDDGTADYTFIASDENNETSSVTISITIAANPPTLSATNGTTELSAAPGALTTINLTATNPSGAALTRLAVLEGGSEATGTDRFFFDDGGTLQEFEGGVDLSGDDQNGFTKDLTILVNYYIGTTDSYTIELTDANGQTATLAITVEATGTALDLDANGVLLNAAGPQGQGGLDLDTGNGNINSDDASAEIRDQGIDLSRPVPTNWRQQIAPNMGRGLVKVEASDFPEGVGFDEITTKEQIEGILTSLTNLPESDPVQQGDIFGVFDNATNRFYLLRVASVSLTSDDNADSNTFDIKW